MKEINVLIKVVLTGPESSGKTTLANDLAKAFNTSLVPEFSRQYLEHLGRSYNYNDLNYIYLGQKSWEKWHQIHSSNPVLICDTDWTVLRIWELFRFGTTRWTEKEKPALSTHYFLCSPDMPWLPDPLREDPEARGTLFDLYLQLLTDSKANFIILHGDESQRLNASINAIRKLL